MALLAVLVSGCSRKSSGGGSPGASAEFERSTLRYQGFAGQVTYPELAADLGYLAPLQLEYVGNTISGPQDIQTVVTRDIDFGGAFNGAVIKLMAAKAPITAVMGYYGVDENRWSGYFVLDDSPIHSVRDFIGKKVSVNTVGAHQEFVLREYLARGGLLQYWRSTGIAGTGGLINEREYQIWIDWLVKDGQLQPRQLVPTDLYTNELNPFAKGPA